MKKIIAFFMMVILFCMPLCACGSRNKAGNSGSDNAEHYSTLHSVDGDNSSSETGKLRLLGSRYGEGSCITENGYYYLVNDTVELRDGTYGTHLMYMDFATGREIYLCSTAGCKHDSPDCPAVFLYDDFPIWTTILFVFGDNLYILSREYDDDGSMSQDTMTIGDSKVESQPAALYRAKLDGTERKKIYTFDPELTIEDKVFGNDDGIYVVTKKLSVEKNGNQTYTTSSERKLMFLDLDSLSIREMCPMTFDDNISWKIIGCCQNDFVLSGTDFGKEISQDEKWNDDLYRELYNNSSQVYAVLNPNDGKLKELCRQSNRYENSSQIIGDSLYLSSTENQNIEVLNIRTGENKTLCSLPQNFLMDAFDDTLCCRDWNLGENPTFYFVNTKTGTITRTPLTILCNGWSIDFRGETASDILFIYDYDATAHEDGSYEIYQYKHALISKDDLFEGRENYRKIEMIGPGQ